MNLFKRVAEHREIFFRQSWVDYSTHHPGTFRLVPSTEQLSAWEADFAAMRGPMFFGPVPVFAEILTAVRGFERRFNQLVLPS